MTAIANIFFKNKTIIATDSLAVFCTDLQKLGAHCCKSQHYPHLQCVVSTSGSQELKLLLDQFIHRHPGLRCMEDLQDLLDDNTFLNWLKNHPYLAMREVSENGFLGIVQIHGISLENKVRVNDIISRRNGENSKRLSSVLISTEYNVCMNSIKSRILFDPDIFPFNSIELVRNIDYHLSVCYNHETRDVNFDKHPVIDLFRDKINRNNMADNITALTSLISSYHDISESNKRETTIVGGQLHFTIIENCNGILVASSFVGYEFPDFEHNIDEILINQKIRTATAN